MRHGPTCAVPVYGQTAGCTCNPSPRQPWEDRPLEVVVERTVKTQQAIPSGSMDPTAPPIPGAVQVSVVLRGVCKTQAEFDTWASLVGRTLQVVVP